MTYKIFSKSQPSITRMGGGVRQATACFVVLCSLFLTLILAGCNSNQPIADNKMKVAPVNNAKLTPLEQKVIEYLLSKNPENNQFPFDPIIFQSHYIKVTASSGDCECPGYGGVANEGENYLLLNPDCCRAGQVFGNCDDNNCTVTTAGRLGDKYEYWFYMRCENGELALVKAWAYPCVLLLGYCVGWPYKSPVWAPQAWSDTPDEYEVIDWGNCDTLLTWDGCIWNWYCRAY